MRKFLLLLLAGLPAMAYSQGFQVNLGGQKQIAMGHTGTGLLQDGASVFFNPGAVAMLSENSIQAGISPLMFRSTFNPTGTNAQYHTASNVATPFNVYGVWGPKNGWFKLGMGVYTPFGGLTKWGNDWAGKYALESLDLKTIYYQPTISIKLADFLSIGGGFVYNHGTVDLQRAIPLNNANGQDGQARLTGSGKGYGWNVGLFAKTESGVTIGFSYRSQVKTTINNGDAFFSVPNSLQANFPQPNTFTASLPLPSTASVGFGFYPSKKWTLAFDANLVSWNAFKSLAFDYAVNTPVLQDTNSPRLYRDAVSLRAGTEYKPVDKWAIRAGAGYATKAAQDGFVSPEVPDANRYFVTAGLGYKIANRLDLDLSFEFEHLFKRTQTNIETNLAGSYVTDVYIPGISFTYHW